MCKVERFVLTIIKRRLLLLAGNERDEIDTLTQCPQWSQFVSITFLRYLTKSTALRTQITLKAPPAEWIYKQLCRLLAPHLLTESSTQTEFLFFRNYGIWLNWPVWWWRRRYVRCIGSSVTENAPRSLHTASQRRGWRSRWTSKPRAVWRCALASQTWAFRTHEDYRPACPSCRLQSLRRAWF